MTPFLKRYLKQHFSFQGKTKRAAYAIRTLVFLLSSTFSLALLVKVFELGSWEVLFGVVWFVAWMWSLCSMGVRRCRDVGINPHWLWLWLIPTIGSIFYIILGCLQSDDGRRIARPPKKQKQGLVRYLSVFGYATRQEYWCILLPISTAIAIATLILEFLISFLFSSLLPHFPIAVILLSLLLLQQLTAAWLTTATIFRRCRDMAGNLMWAVGFSAIVWSTQISLLFFFFKEPQNLEQTMAKIALDFATHNSSITTISVLVVVLLLTTYIVFGCLTSKKELDRKLQAP